MNVHMTSKQHDALTNLCQNSDIEQSGTIEVVVFGNNICLQRLIPAPDEEIAYATENSIAVNDKQFIRSSQNITESRNGLYVAYHSHHEVDSPPILSKAEMERMAYFNGYTEHTIKPNDRSVTVIEALITYSEIAFYACDYERKSVTRLPLFVDGVEKIPVMQKTKWQLLLERIKIRKKKAKVKHLGS